MWDLLFLATIVAFLAFMTLKHQNTEFPKYLTPYGTNYLEKPLSSHIFDPVAFKSTFTAFVGLFHFLWDLLCFLRPLVCKNVKFMQKTHLWNFWTNFAQIDHSVTARMLELQKCEFFLHILLYHHFIFSL